MNLQLELTTKWRGLVCYQLSEDTVRPQGIMLQILIIILFQISPK